jgi:CRISPR-associated protein Csm1
VDQLDGLLARYTWSIPSATNAAPDVPLYDHLHTVGALAETLYRHYKQSGVDYDERAVRSEPQRPRLLLVGGDISGIQRYLFRSRVAKGQARQLRARSFLLSVLTRAVASQFLKQLNLPHVCLISEAGGRFQFVAPHSAETERALASVKDVLTEAMLVDFLGEITLNVGWTPLSIADFQPKAYQLRVADLGLKIEAAKSQPLGGPAGGWQPEKFVRDFPVVETPEGGAPSAEDYGPRPGRGQLEEIGRELVRCSHWILSEDSASLRQHGISIPLLNGMLHAGIAITAPRELDRRWLRAETYSGFDGPLPMRPLASHVPRWTEQSLAEIPQNLWYDPAKDSPPAVGQVMPFSALAASGVHNGRGRPLLAVLKADVDRLGQIFGEGLRDRMTLARYAGLSRMLDHFFGARLMRILQDDFPRVYTVYSGGDDLLLAGPWEDMFKLAARLRESFGVFTGGNENITLSAALVLISPRLPIRQAVDIAEEDLDAAKAAGGNRITVFGRTMKWRDYSAPRSSADIASWSALEQGNWLVNLFGGEQAPPTSFLRHLLRFARLAEDLERQQRAGQALDIRLLQWPSHYHYQLGRNVLPSLAKRLGSEWKRSPEGQFWVSLGEVPKGGQPSRMARLAVPVEFALHGLRKQ